MVEGFRLEMSSLYFKMIYVGTAYINTEVSQLDLVAFLGENSQEQLPGFSIGSSFSFRIHTTTFDSSVVMNLEMELVQGDGVFGRGI